MAAVDDQAAAVDVAVEAPVAELEQAQLAQRAPGSRGATSCPTIRSLTWPRIGSERPSKAGSPPRRPAVAASGRDRELSASGAIFRQRRARSLRIRARPWYKIAQ